MMDGHQENRHSWNETNSTRRTDILTSGELVKVDLFGVGQEPHAVSSHLTPGVEMKRFVETASRTCSFGVIEVRAVGDRAPRMMTMALGLWVSPLRRGSSEGLPATNPSSL